MLGSRVSSPGTRSPQGTHRLHVPDVVVHLSGDRGVPRQLNPDAYRVFAPVVGVEARLRSRHAGFRRSSFQLPRASSEDRPREQGLTVSNLVGSAPG